MSAPKRLQPSAVLMVRGGLIIAVTAVCAAFWILVGRLLLGAQSWAWGPSAL